MARLKASLFLIVFLLASLLLASSALEPAVAEPAADEYVFSRAWGAEGDQIRTPEGMAVADNGTIYVANTYLNRITKISQGERTFYNWGKTGSGPGQFSSQFSSPRGIAVDKKGNVYVTDTDNHRIQKFSSSGAYLLTWGWGVQDGSAVFQTCISGCQAGIQGSGGGQFSKPRDVAVDADGNVYVADSDNHRIQKFSSSGAYLLTWGWGVQDGSAVFQTCISGCQAGIQGSGGGQFSKPRGVAVDADGNVYVADSDNHRIQKFSSSGAYLLTWGWGVQDGSAVFQTCISGCQAGIQGSGGGQFSKPRGVAVDADGNVYVADSDNHRIQKFSSSGAYLLTWGWGVQDGSAVFQTCISGCQAGIQGSGGGQFSKPRDVAVDADGNVYVADTDNHRIQKISSTGTYLTQWGSKDINSAPGQFRSPTGIAVDGDGNVYVADTYNNRIQKFNSSGAYLTQWGSAGTEKGQFSLPRGVAVDKKGNVYVTDSDNHRIQKFSSGGAYLLTWGWGVQDGSAVFQTCISGCQAGIQGSGGGQFSKPRGVAVDADGNVYVADSDNHRIQKFSSSGAYLLTWGWGVQDGSAVFQICISGCQAGIQGSGGGQFSKPRGVAVDADGNVYVADSDNHRIQKFSSSGAYLTQWGGYGSGAGQFASPHGITVDGDGNVYVADSDNHRIQKFSSSGAYLTQWGGYGSGAGQFASPHGITVDGDSNVYVTDTWNDRIQVFSSTYPTPNPTSGLVFNGSFEGSASLPGWAYGGSLPVARGTRAIHGNFALQLGEEIPSEDPQEDPLVEQGMGEAGAHQTFYVPSTWSRPVLTFRYNMFVNDTMHLSDFFVVIQDGLGLNHLEEVLRDGYKPCIAKQRPVPRTNLHWRSARYPLSAFKGQHIRLVFANRNLWPYSLGIWTHVDDVRVTDAGPLPPPPGDERSYLPFVGHKPCDPIPEIVSNEQSNPVSLLRPAITAAAQKRE